MIPMVITRSFLAARSQGGLSSTIAVPGRRLQVGLSFPSD
jgi:hypothetical protein